MCPVSTGGNPGIVQKCQACKDNTSIGKLAWIALEHCNVGCKLQGWLLTKTTDPSLWNVRPLSPKIGFYLLFPYVIHGIFFRPLCFLVARWPKTCRPTWAVVEAGNQEAALETPHTVLGCSPFSAHCNAVCVGSRRATIEQLCLKFVLWSRLSHLHLQRLDCEWALPPTYLHGAGMYGSCVKTRYAVLARGTCDPLQDLSWGDFMSLD